jgi:holo-[acyl-carrier protein] synthase
MELLGLGTQILDCEKVAKLIDEHGETFLREVFTAKEIRRCRDRAHSTEAYTAVWACKEAVFRALGTRWNKEMSWLDVEICHDKTGDSVTIHGPTKDRVEARRVKNFMVSSSHTRRFATATAIAVG